MRSLAALYRRELAAYFHTPTAYVLSVVFLLITGYFFATPLFLTGQASIAGFTDLAPMLLAFLVPAITMRHFSEEFKSGTMEVLMTFPVRDWEIVAAKFLAAETLLCAMLACTLVYPISVSFLGSLDWGGVAGAYAGLALTGAVLIAAGMFASSLTRNQIIAFIVGVLLTFTLFALGKVGDLMPLRLSPLTDYLGLDAHLASLSRGVLDTRDLLYYASGTGLFLFLAQVRLWLLRSE
jgi:gliding motility-associated transport system permease protein